MNLERHTRVSKRRQGLARYEGAEGESRPAKARAMPALRRQRDVLVQVIHGHHAEDEFPGCWFGYAEGGQMFGILLTDRQRSKQGPPNAPASVTSANWTLLPPGACCSAKNASSFSSGVSGVITASGSHGVVSPRARVGPEDGVSRTETHLRTSCRA